MKRRIFASCLLTLSLYFYSCQNTSQHKHATSAADSSEHTVGHSEHGEMKSAMDKMMKDMHEMKMTGNVDVDFALMMKSHHDGAVDMATEELASGSDERLKELAQTVVASQTAEITEFENFIETHKNPIREYEPTKTDEGFAKVLHKNMSMMMDMPHLENSASTDRQFLEMMIPHHETAVYMSEGFLQYGNDESLKSLARNIIAGQGKEIDFLKNLRKEVK